MSGRKRKKRSGSAARNNNNQKPQELNASSSKSSSDVSADAKAAAESTKIDTSPKDTAKSAPGGAAKETAVEAKAADTVKKADETAKEKAAGVTDEAAKKVTAKEEKAADAKTSSEKAADKKASDAKAAEPVKAAGAAVTSAAVAQANTAAKGTSTKDTNAKGTSAKSTNAKGTTATSAKPAPAGAGASAGGKSVKTNTASGKAPVKPAPKSNRALIIGLLIGAACIILLGIVLYVRFLVPREIHISESQLTINVGDTAKLSYTILPESADNLEVAWASSDEKIASIDEFGVVTGVSGGACTIAVASGNGKTDICVVTVIDPTQIQKDSLDGVLTYIEEQENLETKENDSASYLGVDELDDRHDFLIGKEGDALLLVYQFTGEMKDMGLDAEYTTYLRIQPKNIETAEVVQKNSLVLYDFPIDMIGTGVINLKTYEYDDPITLDNFSSTVNGLDAVNNLQELATVGVTECVKGFSKFLVDQDFQFGLSEFGLAGFGAIEKDLAENAAASEDAESNANPEGNESTVSNFEALGQSSPQGDAVEADSSQAEEQQGSSGNGQAFSEFPKAGPTSSTLSMAVDSLAKSSAVEP